MSEHGIEAPKMNPTEALLRFERALRACKSLRELRFVAVNEGFGVVRYDQAVLWEPDAFGRVLPAAISGLAENETESPYAHWLGRVCGWARDRDGERTVRIAPHDLPEAIARDGAEWQLAHAVHSRLESPDGRVLGGLWTMRAGPFGDAELARLDWIANAVAFSLWAWRRDDEGGRRILRGMIGRWQTALLAAAIVGAGMLPVELSALAQAEVTPIAPMPVTAPIDGVVARVLVTANQPVHRGDPLVQLDDTVTRNRLLVAQKALETARADLQRASSRAFAEDAGKAEIQLLDARVRERVAEVNYLAELLARLRIVAPQDGVAVFADAEQWRGRPVQTGERIMILADPGRVGLTVYLAPDDALHLEPGAPVRMYLNTAPLDSHIGKVTQTSYETGRTPEGVPAYILKAEFTGSVAPRVGLKGTAKVYGDPAPLAYHVLRRPLRYITAAIGL